MRFTTSFVKGCLGLVLAAAWSTPGWTAPAVRLAADGQARLDVVVCPEASERVRHAATELASYLERITGAEFAVTEGDGHVGITVGLGTEFPALAPDVRFEPEKMLRRDDYLLRSHEKGVYLLGATELAVEHAVWDFLYRLGHRQFFPGEAWEVVPHDPSPSIMLDTLEQPDFYQRNQGVGHGLLAENKARHRQWLARNRWLSSVELRTSHVYQSIIRRNRAAFEEHPEYLALVDGERKGNKFCIANPGLRALVVEDAVRQIRENPEQESISMEPSDGGGWCECEACAKMGSTSDRVVILANAVAEAINALGLGEKYVGLLAYHVHSPPPSVKVHPRIIVRAATNGVRFGYKHQEIIDGWSKMGATMGVFDLYSVHMWDQSQPARQKGSDIPYITESLTRFHRTGARYMSLAHSDNFGPSGLGMVLAGRILWDVGEAERVQELIDDFMDKSFGRAAPAMRAWFEQAYNLRETDRRPLIREDMFGRMYRALQQARPLADNDAIRTRIDHLVLYTRYGDCFARMAAEDGEERQKMFDELLRLAWRIRDTHMVHTRPIMAMARSVRGGVTNPPPKIVRDDYVYTDEDIEGFIRDGVERHKIVDLDFEPAHYSRDLVPSAPLNPPQVEPGNFGGVPRGRLHFYTWLDEPGEIAFEVTGGYSISYPHLVSNIRVDLFADGNPTGEAVDTTDHIEPNQKPHDVRLRSTYPGLHRIRIEPTANRAVARPPEGRIWTMEVSQDEHNTLTGDWDLYFYVPKRTRVVGGFTTSRRGVMLDGDGQTVFSFRSLAPPAYFSVPVPEEQSGRFWKLSGGAGHHSRRILLTVPPFLARTPAELLLPREVVEADRQ